MLLLLLASSCSSISDSKDAASTSLAESILEKATGQKLDMADAKNLEKIKIFVKLQVGSENLESVFEGAVANVTGSKETIVISAIKEVDNQQLSLMIGFTATDLTTMRPIKGSINTEDPSEANLMISLATISENGIETMISKEGFAEIVSINDNKVVVCNHVN